jgi:putative phosphoesterase
LTDALIGLIGDVHAEDENLELALAFLNEHGAGRILCTGDIIDGEGDADRCCELLQIARVSTVRGNHDQWCLAGQMRDLPHATELTALAPSTLRFLHTLPPTLSFPTELGSLLLCHGLGENNMARLMPDEYGYSLEANTDLHGLLARPGLRFVVAGHTHRRMVRQIEQTTFINPGSLIPAQDCGCMIFYENASRVVAYTGLEEGHVSSIRQSAEFVTVAHSETPESGP